MNSDEHDDDGEQADTASTLSCVHDVLGVCFLCTVNLVVPLYQTIVPGLVASSKDKAFSMVGGGRWMQVLASLCSLECRLSPGPCSMMQMS